MFKVEKGDNGELLDNVLFLGISGKRYNLSKQENGKITILKHSSHALGGINSMPKGWEEKFWIDIIKYNRGMVDDGYIESNYGNFIVAGKLAISSPFLMRRFNKINRDKDFNHRIKPFNFITVGVGYRLDGKTRESIIPILPYTTDIDTIKYMPFIDYKTGKEYKDCTQFYWRPMSDLFFSYIAHREEKFLGEFGTLENRHINIVDTEYCGKESNNLQEAEVIGVQKEDYVYYRKDFNQKIAKCLEELTKEEARQAGISDWQFYYLKKKAKRHEIPQLKKKTLRLLGLL